MFLQPRDRNQEVFPQFQNGRVINITEKPVDWYQMFDNNKPNDSFKDQALYGIQNKTLLSQVFFSKENVKLVNDMIRYNVWLKSDKKYVIGDQSTVEISVIMRSIFLQHSRHLNFNITEQVRELNNILVNVIVSRVISAINQYYGYLHRVENLPQPIQLPKNMSDRGSKLLRSVTSTF